MPPETPYPARQELDRQGVTITSLARDMGVGRSHLTDVMNGRREPSFQLVLLISMILQKPVTEMFPGVDRPVRADR